MQTLSEIRLLLERAGHSPKKALGQNFLTDHNMIRKLVDDSGIVEGDRVLEIGPGTGALTVELLERGADVVACELDRDLAGLLRETLSAEHPERFSIIEGDCLHSKRVVNPELIDAMGDHPFALIANLPYHAATPLMLALMTRHPGCTGMFVTIQHEVVERFNAKPSTKAFGTISVIAQQLGSVGTISKLPPGCFWPQPSVASAMMRWVRDPQLEPNPQWWVQFAQITQQLFQTRRKQLGGVVRALAGGEIDWPQGIETSDRIDALSSEQIELLCRAIDRIHCSDPSA